MPRKLPRCLFKFIKNSGKSVLFVSFMMAVTSYSSGGGVDNGTNGVIPITTGSTPSNPDASRFRAKIKLLPPPAGKKYFAAFPDFGGEENMVTADRIKAFEALAKKKITWAQFSQNWQQGLTYPKVAIHTIHDQGIVPLVRMMPRSNFDEYKPEKKYSMANIIKGKFDLQLRQWARQARQDGIAFMFDFAVEMNGKWFPWNGYWNGGGGKMGYGDPTVSDGPERYRDAYRHIINIFRQEKVNHVTWLFHVAMDMDEPSERWNEPKNYYPGDDYIDWVGVSIYGAQNTGENYWDTFGDIVSYRGAYQKLAAISSVKPIAILELGVTDHHPLGNKADWLKAAFKDIKSNKYLNFQAVTYWHENWDDNSHPAAIRIDSSPQALAAFQNEIKDDIFISTARFSQ